MEWMAEVETDDSIRDVATVSEMEGGGRARDPILFAHATRSQGVGTEAGRGRFCPRSGIYEYTFVNGLCQVL